MRGAMGRLPVAPAAVLSISILISMAPTTLAAATVPGSSPKGACIAHSAAQPCIVPVKRSIPGDARRSPVESPHVRQFKHVWLGAGVELELMALPSLGDVCALDPVTGMPSNGHGVYCTTRSGSDFPARAVPLENAGLCTAAQVASGLCPADAGGQSRAGLARGNLRLMASFDYAVTANLLIGARIGATLFPYPGRAAVNDGRELGSRFYGEVRGTWVFGASALGSPGIKPLVLVGGGVAQFDAHTSSGVAFCPSAQSVASGKPCQVPLFTGTVNVWQTGGPGFGTLGLGLRWLVTSSIAMTAAVRVNLSFRESGVAPSFVPFVPTFGPEVAAQYGF